MRHSDVDDLVKLAVEQGWSVYERTSGLIEMSPHRNRTGPGHSVIVQHGSTGRNLKNHIAKLKHLGLICTKAEWDAHKKANRAPQPPLPLPEVIVPPGHELVGVKPEEKPMTLPAAIANKKIHRRIVQPGTIGAAIREARIAKGYASQEVASTLGVPLSRVSDWELSKSEPKEIDLDNLRVLLESELAPQSSSGDDPNVPDYRPAANEFIAAFGKFTEGLDIQLRRAFDEGSKQDNDYADQFLQANNELVSVREENAKLEGHHAELHAENVKFATQHDRDQAEIGRLRERVAQFENLTLGDLLRSRAS